MPTFDTITEDLPLFSLGFRRQICDDGDVFLTPQTITFKDKDLYNLFKQYMVKTIVDGCRDIDQPMSLAAYYTANFYDETMQAELDCAFGLENTIGKFFLETDLDWPKIYYQTDNDCDPIYKQPTTSYATDDEYGKGVKNIYLARQGRATIPDDIINRMQSYHVREIKKVAPFIAQDQRTSSFGFFAGLPNDYLGEVASYLAPTISPKNAADSMMDELEKAQTLHESNNMVLPFSFDVNAIGFSKKIGTHVALTTTSDFKKWFDDNSFRIGDTISCADGYTAFKLNKDTIAINRGSGTPGIQIKRQGDNFLACNNMTADINKLGAKNLQLGLEAICKTLVSKPEEKEEAKVVAKFGS